MRAHEPGDPRAEQRLDERGAPAVVIGVVVGEGDVGDVVHEARDGQLHVVRVLGAQDGAALERVGETVEPGLVAHAGAAREQLDQIGDRIGQVHVHIFAACARRADHAAPGAAETPAADAGGRYAGEMADNEQNRPRSHEVTDGNTRAPARAMLRAIGMTDGDWGKAQVGVASSWNEVTPCNMPLDRLAKRAKVGVRDAGGFPIEFVTIAVSDGISMGHEGMRGSLVSREIITDSVECVMHAERFDALVAFAGCDKSLPGMLMAAARINLPSVFLYGGSILPGHYKDQALDIVSVFEAVGACAAGTITENELGEIERRACPTEGSCAGMFTANTMASVGEAIGMALPGQRVARPRSTAAATTSPTSRGAP